MNKIIFSKTNDTKQAQKLRDIGVYLIDDFDTRIIKNQNDLESCVRDDFLLFDCENLYNCFYLFSRIPKRIKSIIHLHKITPHIAYMAFSVGFSGILCDIDEIYKNGAGRFIYKLKLAYKKSKNDRFYSKFFSTKKPFTQLRNININRILEDLSADSIALDLSDSSFRTFLYILKNKHIIKIGIINNKNQFKLARNLQDSGELDVLELESSDGLDYANFAFYTRFDLNFDMQIK